MIETVTDRQQEGHLKRGEGSREEEGGKGKGKWEKEEKKEEEEDEKSQHPGKTCELVTARSVSCRLNPHVCLVRELSIIMPTLQISKMRSELRNITMCQKAIECKPWHLILPAASL